MAPQVILKRSPVGAKTLAASDKHTQPLPRLGKRQDASHEKVFCARGNAENLIKDMKRLTRSDKTACSHWQANQFRLFLHVGAYWLLHSLRQAAPKRSRWRGATFELIRRTFVKVAVRVEQLNGRIKLAFPGC